MMLVVLDLFNYWWKWKENFCFIENNQLIRANDKKAKILLFDFVMWKVSYPLG